MNEALKELRARAGYSVRELAEALGKPWSTYASYERETYKQPAIPVHLARALAPLLVDRGEPAITLEEVMRLAGVTGELAPSVAASGSPGGKDGRSIRVPEVAARPQGGHGAADIDEGTGHAIVAHWSIPAPYLRAHVRDPDAVRVVTVVGDSMEPDYPSEEKVFVDTGHQSPSPPGIYVLWDGLGMVLKRVELLIGTNPQRVRLSSINPAYPPYEVPLEGLHINGRVIGKWTWK